MVKGSAKKQTGVPWVTIVAIICATIILSLIIVNSPPEAGERLWNSTIAGITAILEKSLVTAVSLALNAFLALIIVYLSKKCEISWTLSMKGSSGITDKRRSTPKE